METNPGQIDILAEAWNNINGGAGDFDILSEEENGTSEPADNALSFSQLIQYADAQMQESERILVNPSPPRDTDGGTSTEPRDTTTNKRLCNSLSTKQKRRERDGETNDGLEPSSGNGARVGADTTDVQTEVPRHKQIREGNYRQQSLFETTDIVLRQPTRDNDYRRDSTERETEGATEVLIPSISDRDAIMSALYTIYGRARPQPEEEALSELESRPFHWLCHALKMHSEFDQRSKLIPVFFGLQQKLKARKILSRQGQRGRMNIEAGRIYQEVNGYLKWIHTSLSVQCAS